MTTYVPDFEDSISSNPINPDQTAMMNELLDDFWSTESKSKNADGEIFSQIKSTKVYETEDSIQELGVPKKIEQTKKHGGLQQQSDEHFHMEEPVDSLQDIENKKSKKTAIKKEYPSRLPLRSNRSPHAVKVGFKKPPKAPTDQSSKSNKKTQQSSVLVNARLKNQRPRKSHPHFRHISQASLVSSNNRSLGWGETVGTVIYAASDEPTGRFVDYMKITQQVDSQKVMIQKLKEENKTLKIINQRQERAIQKMDKDVNDLPQVIHDFNEQLRVVRSDRKAYLERIAILEKNAKNLMDENYFVKEKLGKAVTILRSKNLEGNDKLQETIEELNKAASQKDTLISDLKKQLEYSANNRNMEIRDFKSKISKLIKDNEQLKQSKEELLDKIKDREKVITALQIQYGVQANTLHRKPTHNSEEPQAPTIGTEKTMRKRKPRKKTIQSNIESPAPFTVLETRKDINFKQSETKIHNCQESEVEQPETEISNAKKSDIVPAELILPTHVAKKDIKVEIVPPNLPISKTEIHSTPMVALAGEPSTPKHTAVEVYPQNSIHKPKLFPEPFNLTPIIEKQKEPVETVQNNDISKFEKVKSEPIKAINPVIDTPFETQQIQTDDSEKLDKINEVEETIPENDFGSIQLLNLDTEMDQATSVQNKSNSSQAVESSSTEAKPPSLEKKVPEKLSFLNSDAIQKSKDHKLDFLKDFEPSKKDTENAVELFKETGLGSSSKFSSRRKSNKNESFMASDSELNLSSNEKLSNIPEKTTEQRKQRTPGSAGYKPSFGQSLRRSNANLGTISKKKSPSGSLGHGGSINGVDIN
ncbi:Lebercilin [Nowakowskiella sp. JEL0407]|nr:Lebercilin [Nowakowskiella sp. JEL0407]